ncbi:NUDIX hydrolase [Yoonia sediminilitoris]|uniref:8-oxo-dGTP pyrophosphatase MutT (NUDIX family) n=1 Tax=Yoonia sediminilitoris TaxID=1286148 RepID=A0A2T6K7M7_9RHOB|nr:NUDIX domain-containing protein [Yoonia sediminilitoris]PUB10728.1 8-oxo-dGTP pyrophosphatase MutT (NUDIX family) [Yoonia sediminilitoris]RCW90480.1 8-oxo-dGTP pyrophosphatase MutT (NUDIX family) [Yoonia sediminilitoris]
MIYRLGMSFISETMRATAPHQILQQEPALQVAAFCHRPGYQGRELLLITSSSGRWILPKGWTEEGIRDGDAAALEAWEEAGVIAKCITDTPIGHYHTKKTLANRASVPCHVQIFDIEVQSLANDFPEAHKRDRRWVPFAQAASEVSLPALSDALARCLPACEI